MIDNPPKENVLKEITFSKEYNTKLELFLKFMPDDSRIFDGYRWSESIKSKFDSVTLRYKEVLDQIDRCSEDLERAREELDEIGYTDSGIECPKLAYKYEDFLNSIYALCENLSRIVAFLYPKNNLPQGFYDQKKRFLEGNIDQGYVEILKRVEWYDEIHTLRSESIHFLSGMVTGTNGDELGYLNVPKSSRSSALNKIKIDSIRDHINIIYKSVVEYILSFGDYFVQFLNKDSKAGFPCIRTTSGLLGAEERSLHECLSNLPGRCVTRKLDCPLRACCKARMDSS